MYSRASLARTRRPIALEGLSRKQSDASSTGTIESSFFDPLFSPSVEDPLDFVGSVFAVVSEVLLDAVLEVGFKLVSMIFRCD